VEVQLMNRAAQNVQAEDSPVSRPVQRKAGDAVAEKDKMSAITAERIHGDQPGPINDQQASTLDIVYHVGQRHKRVTITDGVVAVRIEIAARDYGAVAGVE